MNSHEPLDSIAIVGMAGRFPQAQNLAEFWRNLREGRESISFFKDEPLQWLPIEHPPQPGDPRYVRSRAVLEKPEWFDAPFFGMNPKEAAMVQAIRFEKTGGPEVLTWQQVSVDKPGPGQVRLKHTAVGLNSAKFGDQIHRLLVTRPRLISRGSHHHAQGSLP